MDLIQPLLSVALVVALLWITIRLLQGRWPGSLSVKRRVRWNAGSETLPVQLAGRLPLSPQHTVHLVHAGERSFLLATHPSGVICLAEWSGANEGLWEVKSRTGSQTQPLRGQS